MQTFSCKIELSGPLGTSSIMLEVDGDVRTAFEWLMLAGHRDESKSLHSDSIKVEHVGAEVVIRIDKSKASEIAVAQRFS
jgi:hypothetical protein